MKVLIDADAYIAIHIVDDALHESTAEILSKYKGEKIQFFTTWEVVDEVATKISYFSTKTAALNFLDDLWKSETEIIHTNESTALETLGLFRSIKSKRVSLTDCFNIITAKEYEIDYIFSFDKIYEKQGLKLLS